MFLENFAGNPLENILVNLSFFHVVQNFVTTVVVKLYRYILHSGFTKSFSAFSDAFSIVSDGVLRSGYKKNRQFSVHTRQVFRSLIHLDSLKHIPIQSGRLGKTAQRICHVSVDHGTIAANPVEGSLGIFHAFIVAAENELPKRVACMGFSFFLTGQAAHRQPGSQDRCRLPAGTADDGGPNAAVRVTVQQRSGQERAMEWPSRTYGICGCSFFVF